MIEMITNLNNKRILLIISGGIAAYKSLELIRLLRKNNAHVNCILTNGGAKFVTPLSIEALSSNPAHTDLWSPDDTGGINHIALSREADLIVIAPASANIIARMANGMADDLASATLLAADKPILIAPAMNHKMWTHPATQENLEKLKQRGVMQIGPNEGDMACNETGLGRMSEPEEILQKISLLISSPQILKSSSPLQGLKALVTSGPTHEPLDPVRFLGNRSSGKQGHAIAIALQQAGADVTLITGPVALPDPSGIRTIRIETAQNMLKECEKLLPVDIAVCAAAVSDWRPEHPADQKLKKAATKNPEVKLISNPDILKTISTSKKRPRIVIGFAAETENLLENATTKLKSKNCDWILANKVSENLFGGDENQVYLITSSGTEEWPKQDKSAVAQKLTAKIVEYFAYDKTTHKTTRRGSNIAAE